LGKIQPYRFAVSNDAGESWAAWLREQFDKHPTIKSNADLVRAGGLKANQRPVIDASSVTQWLRGRRPSFELATATAAAFGVHVGEALAAAGYGLNVWDDEEPTVGDATQDASREEEALLYRRPDGLSDEEWERVKRESREFIEWQIEKASRER
jgi:transcriptional regulator with XRE-family HTH domain